MDDFSWGQVALMMIAMVGAWLIGITENDKWSS